FFQQTNDRMRRGSFEFGAVRLVETNFVTCVFNHGHLHAETDPKVRNVLLARETNRLDFSFDPTVSETARDQQTIDSGKGFGRILPLEKFRLDSLDDHS